MGNPKGPLGADRPFAHCTLSYTVIFENDGTIGFGEVPEEVKRAVRNAVISAIHQGRDSDRMVEGVTSGLFKKEGVEERQLDFEVTVETENETTSLNSLEEIKEELELTLDYRITIVSVGTSGEIADVDEVYG